MHSLGISRGEDLMTAVKRAAEEVTAVSEAAIRRAQGKSRRSESEADLASTSSRTQPRALTLGQQQRAVQDAAMQRYVSSLQREAEAALAEKRTWQQKVAGGHDDERQEIRKKKEQCKEVQTHLRDQIELNKSVRAERRREFIEAASTHSFPLFTETFCSEEDNAAYHQMQRQAWREDLRLQALTQNTIKNLQAKAKQEQAEKRHTYNVAHMVQERARERERIVKQGQDMVNSWDRDIQLKSIKKAIAAGKEVVEAPAK